MRSPRRPAPRTRVRTSRLTRAGALWVVWCRFGGTSLRHDRAANRPGDRSARPARRSSCQARRRSTRAPNATCVLEATIARGPLVARAGGGVYAAGTAGYPTLERVLVWRLDASGVTRKLVGGPEDGEADLGVYDPALAAAPDGRIWVAWVDRRPGGTRIVARRSNKQATSFGAPVTAAPPGGLLTGAVDVSAPVRSAGRRRASADEGGHLQDRAYPAAAWTDSAAWTRRAARA